MRSQDEIEEVMNDAADWEEIGRTGVRGETYEQGVAAALRWVIGEVDEDPIETKARDEHPEEFE